MTRPCRFVFTDGIWVCRQCGRKAKASSDTPPVAVCKQRLGLGDIVAAGLDAAGITKERVQRVASAVGIKDCGCAHRQAVLNQLGARMGLPPGLDTLSTMTGERSSHATEATDGTSEGSGSAV